MKPKWRTSIRSEPDIVRARHLGRALARRAGFSGPNLTITATVITELGRNIILHAGAGHLSLEILSGTGRRGIAVVAADEGPGISNVERALEVGYSSSGRLGLGLPGVRRLMDEMDILSDAGRGTVVTTRKWTSRSPGG